MMLLWMRRKARALEKVENLYRTATAQKNFPARMNKSKITRAQLLASRAIVRATLAP